MDFITPYLPAVVGAYVTLVLLLAWRRHRRFVREEQAARLAQSFVPEDDRELTCLLDDRKHADEKIREMFAKANEKAREEDEAIEDADEVEDDSFCHHGVQDCGLCHKSVERDTNLSGIGDYPATEAYDPPIRSDKVTVPAFGCAVVVISMPYGPDFDLKGITATGNTTASAFGNGKLKLFLASENRYLTFAMSDVLSKDTSKPKHLIPARLLPRTSHISCEVSSTVDFPVDVEIVLYGEEVEPEPEPPEPPWYQISAIPPVGAILGRESDEPFYDRCTLKDHSFQNFFTNSYNDYVTNKSKTRADTNLYGQGGSMLQGTQFTVTGFSLVIETPEIPDVPDEPDREETYYEEVPDEPVGPECFGGSDYEEPPPPRTKRIARTRTVKGAKGAKGNVEALKRLKTNSTISFQIAQSRLRTTPVRQAIGLFRADGSPEKDYTNEPAVKLAVPVKLSPLECFQFSLEPMPFTDGHEITMTLYIFGKKVTAQYC